MNKIYLLLLGILLVGCQTNASYIDPIKLEFENVSFDVVQKQLVIEPNLPIHLHMLVEEWFNQKVKINGFDGEMKFTISDYLEEVTSIEDGKRVDISLSFNVILNKPTLSQIKKIDGSVSSFGTLTGDFSLIEFDTVIQNTQSNLILRLSRYLKSKA